MSLGELWRKLRYLAGRNRLEQELGEEMELHLELRARRMREAGAADGEAMDAARRRFGNPGGIKEDVHEMWSFRWLDRFAADVRLAGRNARKSPSFTLLAIGSLSVGLAAATAVFSFVNAIVLKTLPVPEASRLVILRQRNEAFRMENCCFSYAFLRELRKADTGFEDVSATSEVEASLLDGDRRQQVTVELVSGNFFRLLRVRPQLGRLLDDSDDRVAQGSRACVISDRLWRSMFAASPDVIGRRIVLDKEPLQIVGVGPAGFKGSVLYGRRDVQIPSAWAESFYGMPRERFNGMELMGRLKPGISVEDAAARAGRVGMEIERRLGLQISDRDYFLLRDGSQGFGSRRDRLGKPVLVLLSIVGLVLFMACVNLAALWLVRSLERVREAAIRVALGATRWTVLRQFLAQSLLLAAISGILGWWISRLFVSGLLSLLGRERALLLDHLEPDAAIWVFCAAAAVGCGLLIGILPALRVWRTDPMPVVQSGTLASAGRGAGPYRKLIATQIAVSMALVFTAGLLSRTLRNLRAIDLGFRPRNVIQAPVDFERLNYSEAASRQAMHDLLQRARALPGAQSASLSTINLLSGAMASTSLRIPGYQQTRGMAPTSYYARVSAGYFRTMGIPLRSGRDFEDGDHASGEEGVIVNERFARQFLAGDPLGKVFAIGGGRPVRVVGVVGTTKYRWLREEPAPVLYLPAVAGSHPGSAFLQVRSREPREAILARLGALMRDADPRLPVDRVLTMEAQLDETLASERLLALLSMSLSGLAVALAAIGLYGVLSYSTTRRTREIGIRLAIGATRTSVLGMILRESAGMVAAGVVAGVPLALISGRLIRSQLYGLSAADTGTTFIAGIFLLLVSAGAGLLPAWRATRVDPVSALRYE